MILNDVPLVEIEEKTMNGNIFSKECCIQMIKDIINKDIIYIKEFIMHYCISTK